MGLITLLFGGCCRLLYVCVLFLNSVVVIVSYLRLRGSVCGFCFTVLYTCYLMVCFWWLLC